NWLLESDKGRFILVLADFGTGKTFLLREVARRLADIPGAPSPVLIEMRGLAMREREKKLDRLIAQQLAMADIEYQPSKFRYMLAQGKVALLFDGYDELALRVTYDKAAEYLDLLLEAAEGEFAKVVVSSRSQHFKSDRQVATVMWRKIEDFSRRRIVTLKKFTPEQVEQFLRQYFPQDPDAARRYFGYIEHIQDLMGLSETPRMLKFIAALPEREFQLVKQHGEKIRAAFLYQKILDTWLRTEQERAREDNRDDLELEHRWEAVRLLARYLWRSGATAVSGEELELHLRDIKHRLEHLHAVHKLGSGTLLVRDGDERFSFVHQSVLEWLVAEQAAREAGEGLLAVREFSDLMGDFFIDLAGKEAAENWARNTEQDPSAGDDSRKNARKLLKRLDLKLSVTSYARQNLAGENFSGLKLVKTDFRGALINDAVFTGARLEGADFREAQLRNADFTRANVSGAVFRKADLRGAVWDEARRDGANFESAYGWPFRHALKTGDHGPELILLPAGNFKMGGNRYDFEKPIHRVEIAYDFAIGRYPVTFEEYDRFCVDTKPEKPSNSGWERGRRPVININGREALDYCAWLSAETGRTYRLPSEAEWEYTCRAGSEGEYCYGSDEQRLADYAWYWGNSNGETHSVGEKKPNAWGLYDLHGNVWEWCQDRWHDNYDGAPADGSAWESGDSSARLLRGGSWGSNPGSCRAAYRCSHVNRSFNCGFRVLCVSAPRT
ncbi:MAG: SUMF1/EgtB/PvdO family nonheme iron enzyme, partial [Methylococcales bacterium]